MTRPTKVTVVHNPPAPPHSKTPSSSHHPQEPISLKFILWLASIGVFVVIFLNAAFSGNHGGASTTQVTARNTPIPATPTPDPIYRPTNATKPSWSFDDQYIAWVTPDGIWVISADQTKSYNISATVNDAKWSPVNYQVAFTGQSNPNNPWGINIVDGNSRTLVAQTSSSAQFDWSPDGMQLVFTDNGALYVVNVDGSNLRKMPVEPISDSRHVSNSTTANYPRWSPDGLWITYQGIDTDVPPGWNQGPAIYLVNPTNLSSRFFRDGSIPIWVNNRQLAGEDVSPYITVWDIYSETTVYGDSIDTLIAVGNNYQAIGSYYANGDNAVTGSLSNNSFEPIKPWCNQLTGAAWSHQNKLAYSCNTVAFLNPGGQISR